MIGGHILAWAKPLSAQTAVISGREVQNALVILQTAAVGMPTY